MFPSPEKQSDTDQAAVRVDLGELLALRVSAAAIPLSASRIRALHGQNYRSPFRGRGMEFDESRLYQPGDDVRTLDWRVTARTGKPHTKLFREERERPVIVGVDYRPPMWFATQGRFKAVQAAHCAALVAWKAVQQGDRLGGIIFGADEHWECRPGLRASGALHWLQQLSRHGQRSPADTPAASEHHDSLRNALARLRRVARPGSLVFMLSDFRGLDEHCESHLGQLARHNEMVLVFVYDQLESELPPPGRYPIRAAGRRRVLDTGSDASRLAYAQQFERRRDALQRLSRRHRMTLLQLGTHEDPQQRLQQGLLRALP